MQAVKTLSQVCFLGDVACDGELIDTVLSRTFTNIPVVREDPRAFTGWEEIGGTTAVVHRM